MALTCQQQQGRRATEVSRPGRCQRRERGRGPETETWKAVLGLRSQHSEQLPRHSKTETGTLATACHCHRFGNHLLLPFILYFHTMHTSDGADSSRTTPTAQDAAIRSQVQERSDRKPFLMTKILSCLSFLGHPRELRKPGTQIPGQASLPLLLYISSPVTQARFTNSSGQEVSLGGELLLMISQGGTRWGTGTSQRSHTHRANGGL